MPRYYFHLYNDIECKDDEGKLLPDLQAARAHAISDERAMIAMEIRDKGQLTLSHRIEIEDEHGVIVSIVKFGEAVEING